MALVLCVLFCFRILKQQDMMCGRWNVMLMAIVEGKAICLQFFNVTQNLFKNVADVIPHSPKILHNVPPCDKDDILSNYIIHAPCLHCSPQGYLPKALTGHQLLDLYYARFRKNLYMSYGPTLVGRSQRKSIKAKGVLRGLFH